MKKFTEPEMDVQLIFVADIITTSENPDPDDWETERG